MSESWQQQQQQPQQPPPPPPPQQHHTGAATLPEHSIPPSTAENPLGCAVYGILLQPDPNLQHHQHAPIQAGEPSHKCGVCGHDLAHLSNPHEHQCLPGHDRSFQCTQCLKIFHQA